MMESLQANPSRLTLIGLAPELLLQIADNLKVVYLKELSVTCRLLRDIAQETLVRNAAILPTRVWNLVRLLESRPGLVRAFTHLRTGLGMTGEMDYIPFSQIHDAETPSHDSCNEIQSRGCHGIAMATLVALTTGLKKWTLDTKDLMDFGLLSACIHMDYRLPSDLKQSYRETVMQTWSQLEEVTVKLEKWERPFDMRFDISLDFSRFTNLKRLEIPCWIFGTRSGPWDHFNMAILGAALPQSLESACFYVRRDCFFEDWYYLLLLCHDTLPKLREVEFKFQLNLASVGWYIAVRTAKRAEIRDAIVKLKDSGVSLTTTFGNRLLFDELRNRLRPEVIEYTDGDLVASIDRCIKYVRKVSEDEEDDADEEDEDREEYIDTALMEEIGYRSDSDVGPGPHIVPPFN